MLTTAAVKAAAPRSRAYKLADGRGLHLRVAPTGHRSFRLKYRIGGREKLLTIGSYPEISLADARARCDQAREQLRRGEDPGARTAAADVAGDTFEDVARAWHALRAPRWTAVHAADVLASLERDVFPAIGAMTLDSVDAPAVLELLQAVEVRGAVETARRVRQRISGIYRHAIARKLVSHDPAAVIADELQPAPAPGYQPALEDLNEARALVAEVDQLKGASTARLASRFLALTAVRWACVRGMRWSEIEDLDGSAPLWRIPSERMKMAAAKKRDPRNAHLVPLSAAAVAVLREARHANMHSCDADCLIFGGGGASRPLGEGAIAALYARTSFAGRHVPHGWRATFSTILNEAHPELSAAIDLALAHAPAARGKVEGRYNRAQLLEQRRFLFSRWAELLALS